VPPALCRLLLHCKKHTFSHTHHPKKTDCLKPAFTVPPAVRNAGCSCTWLHPLLIPFISPCRVHLSPTSLSFRKARQRNETKNWKADNEGVYITEVTNLNLGFISLAPQVKVTRKSPNSPENRALVYSLLYLHLPVCTAPRQSYEICSLQSPDRYWGPPSLLVSNETVSQEIWAEVGRHLVPRAVRTSTPPHTPFFYSHLQLQLSNWLTSS